MVLQTKGQDVGGHGIAFKFKSPIESDSDSKLLIQDPAQTGPLARDCSYDHTCDHNERCQARPSRRATWRRLRGRRGGGRDSRLRADPLDLAEEPAKLPVADYRQCAWREAGPGAQEVHLKLCRPRPEADAAVHVKQEHFVARDPVPAQDQVIAEASADEEVRRVSVEQDDVTATR